MELMRLDEDIDPGDVATLVIALDGWTDAGSAATTAAEHLVELSGVRVGDVEPDRVFDFRDRRPLVPIDGGRFGTISWPEIALYRIDPVGGRPLLLLTGAEPDFSWQALAADLLELAQALDLTDYVGLGAVPGPVPHTRPVRVTTTSNDEELSSKFGRAHEKMIVPASAQVTLEIMLGEAGLRTLGLWARIPHYVAGDYPAGSAMLLRRVGEHLGFDIDVSELDAEASQHTARLQAAASESEEVTAHIEALEGAYDADTADEHGFEGPLPTGDQIAAELEQFLRKQG